MRHRRLSVSEFRYIELCYQSSATCNAGLSFELFWFVNHTGVLLNRASILAVNGYRPLRGLAEDKELWVRMMLYGYRRFYNLPDVLVDYRDLPTGLHHNFRRGVNRGMKIVLKTPVRACPNF
jgi:hypothetical protein